MVSNRLAAAAGAVLVVVVGAVLGSAVPFDDNPGVVGTPTEPLPAAAATLSPAAAPEPPTAAGTRSPLAERPSFRFTIDRIEECGQTCRDVTSTLRNDGSANATGVAVTTRIIVGNDTDGDVAWRGRVTVGALQAGGTHTATERVELSLGAAVAIQQADGWITVQTTVSSDQRTVTFTDSRQVV